MSEKPISDLRRRMLEDMAVRKFGEKTQHDYIRHVEAFASLPRPLARHGNGRGRAPLPGAPDRERRAAADASTARPRRCASSSASRWTGRACPPSRPSCTTRGSCRVCCRRRRWVAFWKRHPAPASSTRRR